MNMAKNETAPNANAPAAPVLGSTCTVKVGDGLLLMNTETGAHFAPGEPTSQTVTTTTLRRLADGDLVLVA
jgi:hypothetical protein